MGIIFGPIASRRFGKSLGIDLSPGSKQCNFDCVYCELSPAKTVDHYEEVLSPDTIVDALKQALEEHGPVDVLTVTANGEPTLYPQLHELITKIKALGLGTETLILSNASTVHRPEVREALALFDTVKLSLDCATPGCFKRIDRPHSGIDLEAIKEGMLAFRKEYRGALIVEVLVVKGINDKPKEIAALNDYLLHLKPERIDLGTIDRPPAYKVQPVSYEKLRELSLGFDPSLPVHIASRREIGSITPGSYETAEILETLAKRPLTPEDTALLFDNPSLERLQELLQAGKIRLIENHGVNFYTLA